MSGVRCLPERQIRATEEESRNEQHTAIGVVCFVQLFPVALSLILTTFADPHKKTRGGESTQHLLHLCQPAQNVLEFERNETGVSFVSDVVTMSSFLSRIRPSRRLEEQEEKNAPRDDTCRISLRAISNHNTSHDKFHIRADHFEQERGDQESLSTHVLGEME